MITYLCILIPSITSHIHDQHPVNQRSEKRHHSSTVRLYNFQDPITGY